MVTTADGSAQLGVAASLVRLSHVVQHVFADVGRRHELTPQQLHVLCMLLDGPVGMSELSRMMHLERSSMTGSVDRVVKRGLVSRMPDANDRRACVVTLSDEGRRLAVAAHDDVTARLEALTADIDSEDRERWPRVAERILAAHDPAWVSRR
ncbi:MarR family winged helix-turn-helix transcriptional regulator [Nocardia sp. NBC_00416]|uniref:MarR family winged helix-turn-helix transcriptional regulator n=1 Tax=Nocardia sp. NBC_00416 TaxID=2975991 RepID=UPI002E1BA6E8